jgi:hypothetical protein
LRFGTLGAGGAFSGELPHGALLEHLTGFSRASKERTFISDKRSLVAVASHENGLCKRTRQCMAVLQRTAWRAPGQIEDNHEPLVPRGQWPHLFPQHREKKTLSVIPGAG